MSSSLDDTKQNVFLSQISVCSRTQKHVYGD